MAGPAELLTKDFNLLKQICNKRTFIISHTKKVLPLVILSTTLVFPLIRCTGSMKTVHGMKCEDLVKIQSFLRPKTSE